MQINPAIDNLRVVNCTDPGMITADPKNWDIVSQNAPVVKEQYRFFTAEGLYGIINGGAAEHQKQGLKSGIGLSLTGGTRAVEIYFEDFGTPSRARGMVSIKKKSLSDPVAISHVKVSPAIYEEVLGGCITYWAKSHYYIEMTLTGYDSVAIAVHDAVVLIDSLSLEIVE